MLVPHWELDVSGNRIASMEVEVVMVMDNNGLVIVLNSMGGNGSEQFEHPGYF